MQGFWNIFYRQVFHYLKRLDFRLKIESVILFIIFMVFFTEKFAAFLIQLIQRQGISQIGIAVLIEHILLIPLAVTTPFIYTHLLPRQNTILILRLHPLDKIDTLLLLLLSYLKYELVVIIFLLPVIGAILFTLQIIYLLHLLIITCSSLFILFMSTHILVNKMNGKRNKIYILYFLTVLIYFMLFLYFYITDQYYIFLQTVVNLAAVVILTACWSNYWEYWDQDLFRVQVIRHKSTSSKSHRNWYGVYPFSSTKFNALVLKEILGYTRNIYFLRLKFIGLAIYIFVLIIAQRMIPENHISATSSVTLVYLWIHYTHQFNEKYVLPESLMFLKTFPFRYYQIWSAKFAAELVFLSPVFLILICFLLVSGSSISVVFLVFSAALIFSLFILATIISVKLLFYDNPRKAGYVYHFMVIFSLVMIYNYSLVGPVVIFFVLLYLSILSYRQFVR